MRKRRASRSFHRDGRGPPISVIGRHLSNYQSANRKNPCATAIAGAPAPTRCRFDRKTFIRRPSSKLVAEHRCQTSIDKNLIVPCCQEVRMEFSFKIATADFHHSNPPNDSLAQHRAVDVFQIVDPIVDDHFKASEENRDSMARKNKSLDPSARVDVLLSLP